MDCLPTLARQKGVRPDRLHQRVAPGGAGVDALVKAFSFEPERRSLATQDIPKNTKRLCRSLETTCNSASEIFLAGSAWLC